MVGTGLGEVRFTAPLAWREKNGQRSPVSVAYELRGQGYGFTLGEYDRGLPVHIDPLLQASYLGGSGDDVALAIALGPGAGDVLGDPSLSVVVIADNDAVSEIPSLSQRALLAAALSLGGIGAMFGRARRAKR